MEVILTQDVERIGRLGQVIKVKDGFARNYLFPNKLAVRVTPSNLKKLEEEKLNKAKEMEKSRKQAQELSDKLAALSLTMPVLVHEDEKLFGSITTLEIQRALKEEGFEIDKVCIDLVEPIKQLGIYEVPLKLHPDVASKIKIWVVKK